MGTCS